MISASTHSIHVHVQLMYDCNVVPLETDLHCVFICYLFLLHILITVTSIVSFYVSLKRERGSEGQLSRARMTKSEMDNICKLIDTAFTT